MVTKQRRLLTKIKDMNSRLIETLENDIIIKERILENYENNICNYQSILNFNNFELIKNEKYEKFLDDIINKYNEYEKNSKNIISEEIFINTILSPLYYSMMINGNSKYNENIIKFLNNNEIKVNKEEVLNTEKSKSKYSNIKSDKNIIELNEKKKDRKNNKTDNININKEDNEYIDKIENNENQNEIIENKDFNHMEINNIKHEKSIFNMIILHNGNIAITTFGKVMIYDS